MLSSNLDFFVPENLEYEEAKQHLRSKVRANRKQRSISMHNELAKSWETTVLSFISGAKTVAAFVSTENEPQTYSICTAIADSGVQLLLPKLGPGLTRSWGYFKGIDDLEQLAPGRPPEPSGAAFDNDILKTVDAMIIPALLISKFGERLGQGGGWYDRALKTVNPDLPIGAMVFPEELVDFHLPQDEYDMTVGYALLPDHIVTLETTPIQ